MKIEDIAKLANVSKSAVSLAINGKPGVSEQTRERILTIIEEYNYVPLRNVKAKNIKNTIRFIAKSNPGVLPEKFSDLPFFNELLATLAIESTLESFETIISTLTSSDDILSQINVLEKEKKTDAMILLGTNVLEDEIKQIIAEYPDIVIVDTLFNTIKANFVSINNRMGAYQAVEYLAKNGHKKLGYASGERRIQNFRERKKGFAKGVKDFGMEISPDHIITFDGMSITADVKRIEEIKQSGSWPTAIVCENDYIAISLIKTLSSQGKKVPEDISIIGFDNIGECNIITPELTSISVNKEQLIKQTLKIIRDQLTNSNTFATHLQIGTSLVERASVRNIK